MLAHHARLTLPHTRISMSSGKAIQILRVTRQAALYRFQSSSAVYTMAGNSSKVKFSTGADETSLTAALQELLASGEKGGRWALIPSGQGLERSFKFRNFTKTWVSLWELGFLSVFFSKFFFYLCIHHSSSIIWRHLRQALFRKLLI
jgi:hypothetical protein